MTILENNDLNWRYATKKFDPSQEIPEHILRDTLDVLRLAPSSFGLQPWKFLVIRDKNLRAQLKPYAWDQVQVVDATCLVVLCCLKNLDVSYVNDYVKRIASTHNAPVANLASYEKIMVDFIQSLSPQAISEWMKKQVYLALGMLLLECARRRIDACPMEGFNPEKFDEVLGLSEQNLASVVLCTLGYRADDDKYASLKKVRFDREEVFVQL